MKQIPLLVLWVCTMLTLQMAFAAENPKGSPALRKELEKVYSDYLTSVAQDDAKLLLSVLSSARIADLKQALAQNGMKFPDDYFVGMRQFAPKMPSTGKFKFVAATESARLANLIYVGNMNGFLRKTTDDQRFLIIQFEKEDDGWKYAVVIDPPTNLVPDYAKQLESDTPDFLKKRPFIAEKIELVP